MICKRCKQTAMKNWTGHCPPCWKVVKALRLEAEANPLDYMDFPPALGNGPAPLGTDY